jgi:hypothetical protein
VKYLVVLWLGFNVWTVWKLSGARAGGIDATVYSSGIKGWGLWMWGLSTPMAVAMVYQVNPRHSIFYYGVVFGLLLLPICLWVGYLWGVITNGISPIPPKK